MAPGGAITGLRAIVLPQKGQFTFLNLSPRLNWTLGPDNTLTSQTFINHNRFRNRIDTHTTTLVGSAPPFPDMQANYRNGGTYLRSDLSLARKFASGAKLDLKLGAALGKSENDSRRDASGTGGAAILDTDILLENRDRGVNSTGKYSRTLEQGHTLAVGWDGGVDTRSDDRTERDALRAPADQPPDEIADARVRRLAVFAQDEWNITPRWSMYLGARWEGIRTRVAGNRFGTASAGSSVWSPVIQTLYKLPGKGGKQGGDQLRLAVTRTYKAPGVQSLTPRRQTSDNNSATDPDSQGNPGLKPELAFGIDAGYEHYWAEGALFSVSASMRRISDYTRTLVVFDGARWIATPSNQDRAITRSLELEARFPLKAVMENAPALDLRASLTRNWSRVESVPGPDNRLDQQTPLSVNLGADYKAGALTLGSSFAYRGGAPFRASIQQRGHAFARRDLEAYGLWKFDPMRQLRVALTNVLRQGYQSESTYEDGAFGTQTRGFLYPNGARVRATYELKF